MGDAVYEIIKASKDAAKSMNKDTQLSNLAYALLGTTSSLEDVLGAKDFEGVTEEEAVEYLSAQNIELCEVCSWWCDDWAESDDHDFICTECKSAE